MLQAMIVCTPMHHDAPRWGRLAWKRTRRLAVPAEKRDIAGALLPPASGLFAVWWAKTFMPFAGRQRPLCPYLLHRHCFLRKQPLSTSANVEGDQTRPCFCLSSIHGPVRGTCRKRATESSGLSPFHRNSLRGRRMLCAPLGPGISPTAVQPSCWRPGGVMTSRAHWVEAATAARSRAGC